MSSILQEMLALLLIVLFLTVTGSCGTSGIYWDYDGKRHSFKLMLTKEQP